MPGLRPFSFSAGERKIMNHSVVKGSFSSSLRSFGFLFRRCLRAKAGRILEIISHTDVGLSFFKEALLGDKRRPNPKGGKKCARS
jgi:hypothetical protein